jgi:DNA-binding transcriptional ArsR family regulator
MVSPRLVVAARIVPQAARLTLALMIGNRLYKIKLMDIFSAIADPTRRNMLVMLAAGERTAGDFVSAFPSMSQPSVSQHLKVLRRARLVEVRALAQRRVYSLRPQALQEVDRWLAQYRRFWPQAFEALRRQLEQSA